MSQGSNDRILLGGGIIMFLVGIKLVLSFVFPGLRSPGELIGQGNHG